MDFVSQFLDFTRKYESPSSFWKWSAYGLVGALVRDKVWLNQGMRQLYPNLYVMLLADSGAFRKSGPFVPVKKLLSMKEFPGTKVIAGRASIQAVTDILAQDYIDRETSYKYQGGSGIALPEEYASFFVKDDAVTSMMTNMYDYHPNFEYSLKSGKVKVKRLCFSILGASNLTLLRTVFGPEAIYGGLLARICVVKPDEVRPGNSLLDMTEEESSFERFVKPLQKISDLKGGMEFSPQGKQFYEDWYMQHYERIHKIQDPTGVIGRAHTTVLKVAMILAISNCRMEVTDTDISTAIVEVGKIQGNYADFVMRAGKASDAEIGAELIQELQLSETVSARDFLLRHWTQTTLEELSQLALKLETAGLITVSLAGGIQHYKLTELAKKNLKEGK